MSLINFMDSVYISIIKCDKPQRDGYEVSNLMNQPKSNEMSIFRPKDEFIVDAFVRPPINVKIYFKEPIRLEKITFIGKVNMQISNGFTISTCTEYDHKLENDNNLIFRQIARITGSNRDSQNYSYEFSRRKKNENSESNSNKTFFSTPNLTYVDNVTAINITITRTLHATNPCMKSLKIYGSLLQNDKQSTEIVTQVGFGTSSEQTNKNFDIPTQYLDEITHEIMRLPMLLPSGHMIDKSSLDTYLKEQKLNKNYSETDPFTRIKFDSSYKPVVNDKLKSEIDIYLLNNPHILDKTKNETIQENKLKRKVSSINQPTTSKNGFLEDGRFTIDQSDRPSKAQKLYEPSSDTKKCSCCLNENPTAMYEIETCKHIYCRHCLLSIVNTCIICKNVFEKRHISNIDKSKLKLN